MNAPVDVEAAVIGATAREPDRWPLWASVLVILFLACASWALFAALFILAARSVH